MGVMAQLDDDDLLARVRSHPEAFGVFYRRYERSVMGYFMRRTRDPEVAADLTAETFAAALRSVRRFKPTGDTAAPWLFGIARHTLLRSVERRQVEDRARRRLGWEPLVLDEDLLDRVEAAKGGTRVAELLDRLPDDQAHAIRARVIDELEYAEIAERLRCSQSVVRKRVSRGLGTLRAIVSEDTHE
jgi:RNA polymerase sigma factor (sigma-70 family)